MEKDYTDVHRYFMKLDMDWIMKLNTKIIKKTHEDKKNNVLKKRKDSI
jgi:hypothetical protein